MATQGAFSGDFVAFLWALLRLARYPPIWSRFLVWQVIGLDDVWAKTSYSQWDRYFVWVFFLSLGGWVWASESNEWWRDKDPLVVAAETFGATTGTALSVILATEVMKLVTRPAIELIDQYFGRKRLERQKVQDSLRAEGEVRGRKEQFQTQKAELTKLLENGEISQQMFDLVMERLSIASLPNQS